MSDTEKPADEPQAEAEEAQWERAKPRLKGYFREALDEFFAESDAAPDKPKDGDGAGGNAGGAAPASAGGTGGAGTGTTPPKTAAKRVTGFSISDFLLGKTR